MEMTPLCDRCIQRAAVFLINESSPSTTGESYTLQFCGHHFMVYDVSLSNDGWTVMEDHRV